MRLSRLAPVAAAGTALILSAGPAEAAGVHSAAISSQDKTFILANAQANLAEITLGKLGLAKAQNSATKNLASVTMNDHIMLEKKLNAVAKAADVTLPSAPNPTQVATATKLSAMPGGSFDLAFAQAEVMGHKLAIPAAQKEVAAGSNTGLMSYAKGYVPVATMHLDMANADVAALTSGSASPSTPTAVSAGTGGRATTDVMGSRTWEAGVVGGLGLALLSALALVTGRRRATASASA